MQRRVPAAAVVLIGLLATFVLAGPAGAMSVGPSGGGFSDNGGSAAACDDSGSQPAADGTVSCSAVELDNSSAWRGHHIGGRLAAPVTPAGYGPADLQQAYNLTAASAADGGGKTVAIVDAYDDPFALFDLSTYRNEFGLPPVCGTSRDSRGCITFTKVNQDGGSWPLPAPDPDWSQEISVDLDTVSAVCPNCNILLVEADSATLPALGAAEDTAAAAKPVSIGNSFGVGEAPSELRQDRHFSHAGIAITAAAGDDGYGVQWPASSPDVIAVGGTTLSPTTGPGRHWTETAWSDSGSGCSTLESQPLWQSRISAITGSCAERAVADVAAVADPDTGVAVYDTFGLPGWTVFGGTSVATQIISAVYGLAGGSQGTAASGLYAAPSADFFDITTGTDGTCDSDLCSAGTGWDGPTGLGTPDGTGAF